MRILITGTPSTGKTIIGKKLAEVLKIEFININEVLAKTSYVRYNPELDTHDIIDVNKAKEFVNSLISNYNDCIVECIALELLNTQLIDYVIVLRLNPFELLKRLLNRGWKCIKIRENLFSEILDYFLIKSIELFGYGKVIEVDTTGKKIEDIIQEILNKLRNREFNIGIVDWLSTIEQVDPEFLIKLERCEF